MSQCFQILLRLSSRNFAADRGAETSETSSALYPSASIVGKDRVVFRLKGGAYRLIVKVFYPGWQVYIRFIGTHAEYDRINAEEV